MTTFCDGQLYFWNGMGNLRHPKQRFEEHFAMAKGLAINKDREWLEWTAEQGW